MRTRQAVAASLTALTLSLGLVLHPGSDAVAAPAAEQPTVQQSFDEVLSQTRYPEAAMSPAHAAAAATAITRIVATVPGLAAEPGLTANAAGGGAVPAQDGRPAVGASVILGNGIIIGRKKVGVDPVGASRPTSSPTRCRVSTGWPRPAV